MSSRIEFITRGVKKIMARQNSPMNVKTAKEPWHLTQQYD